MIQDYSNLIRRIEDRYNPDQNRLVEQRMFSDLSTEGRDVAKSSRWQCLLLMSIIRLLPRKQERL